MQRQDRNQSRIKQQLYSYTKLRNITTECLAGLSTVGYCFGFSLCRASMRVTGKLAWWEAAMTLIAEWDGQESSLHNEYILPNANDDTPVSLEHIFDRCIHYLVVNHASAALYPYLNYQQRSFLEPGGDFILLRDNDEILKVQRCIIASGHFEFGDLLCTLNDAETKAALERNICLISNTTHTCELSFNDETQQWHFYDPNYLDGRAKLFATLVDLVNEIKGVLGEDIAIHLAELDDKQSKPFPHYYTVLEQSPEKLIRGLGLCITARFNSHVIPTLIENLKKHAQIDRLQLNVRDSDKLSAMMNALYYRDIEAMKALISVNADVNEATSDGYSLLMLAAEFGYPEEIDFLCCAGAYIEQSKPFTGRTALLVAIKNNHIDAIKMLLNHFADINHDSVQDGTPLMLAIKKGYIEAAQTLLSYSPDLLAIPSIPTAQLLNIAKKENVQAEVEAYIKQQHEGMLPMFTQGMTALHCAIFYDQLAIFSMLLEKIPSVSIEMLTSLKALALAMDRPKAYSLLESHEACSSFSPLNSRPASKRKREAAPMTESSFASLPHPNTLMLNVGEITVKVSLKSSHEWRTLQSKRLAPGVVSMRKVRGELFYLITFNQGDGLEKYTNWYNDQVQEPSFKKCRNEQPAGTSPGFTTLSNSPLSLFTNNSLPIPAAMPRNPVRLQR